MRRLPHTGSAVRQRGVTLVELLIALALSLAVLVGLSAVYVASKQSFRFQETSGRLQEDAAFALETIARDLRMAGFAGCRGVEEDSASPGTYFPKLSMPQPTAISGPNPLATVVPALAAVPPLSPLNFLRGFDNVPPAMFATAPVSSATDSLFFSGGSSNSVGISAIMVAPDSPLTIASDAAGWGSTDVYTMVVSNCSSSSLFAGQVGAGGTSILHTAAIGNSANAFPSSPQYGVDAIVMPVEWSFYYAATRPGASTPSLYRVFYDGKTRRDAEEIISNVESMQVHYGENLNGIDSGSGLPCVLAGGPVTCVPTRQADVWRLTAASVSNWSRVVAVRIGLMMVSADNAANPDVVTALPTLLGEAYTPPVGYSTTRLRKEFSTTVVLRNRVAAR